VDDKDQPFLSLRAGDDPADRAWPPANWASEDEFAAPDERFAGELTAGVTSLGYIRGALRRKARLWCTIGIVGLLAGGAYFVHKPAGYEASAQLVVANPPGSAPGVAVQNDQGIVESVPVAAGALKRLGQPQQAAQSFMAYYTATVITDQILEITAVKASSANQAIDEANALASAFLSFQAQLLQNQQALVNGALAQKIDQSQNALNAINKQIRQLAAQPASYSQKTQLAALRAESDRDSSALTQLKQATASNEAGSQIAITTAIKDSQVLGQPTVTKASRKKRLLEYGGGGLLGGLVLGMGIVVIGAVASDKLRRRDDVARALGAPIRLSVGPVTLKTRGPWQEAAARNTSVKQIVAHLESVLPRYERGLATLAIVPADDVTVPSVCLASLAMSCAEQGMRVVVADLCSGAPAARLLGASDPGVHAVSLQNARLIVMIPGPDDMLPTGPLRQGSRRAGAPDEMAQACAAAELLLTFVALDPATGGDHLAGWARKVVVMVTTGRSTAEHINAVGEMVRLGGARLASGVLLGADKADESLGVAEGFGTDADFAEQPDRSGDPDGFYARVSDRSGSRDPLR
jgi:hypothetical protein